MAETPKSYDWQAVLAATRAYNHCRTGKYDMRPYWRALAYRSHAGEPEPVVRAHAFAAVLDNMALHIYPGDRIFGSRAGFAVDTLPAGLCEEEYLVYVAEEKARGQRTFFAGWDHTLADYPALLAIGVEGLLNRIALSKQTHPGRSEQTSLEAMRIAVEGLSRFMLRYASAPAMEPPRTFQEALQLVWFTHIAFVSEGRYANALGRLDQYLWPFYEQDLFKGRLDREEALNLLCHLWSHIEELGEVTNICVGGLTPDGRDGTNALSFLCIEATRLVQSPHTNLSARFHDNTPDAFHRAAFECIRTGVGFPALFNDHVLIPGLVDAGIPIEAARDHCMVGCIETMLAGRQQAWSDSRFNAPRFLLRAIGKWAQAPVQDWETLQICFTQDIQNGIASHAEEMNQTFSLFPPHRFPDPFLSALTRDCIGRGRDINDGGSEFPRFHGIAIMGLANVADSLAAIKKLVIEEKRVCLPELLDALSRNFSGQEPLRQMLLQEAPKYGNNNPSVDEIAAWFVTLVADACLLHRTVDNGRFVAAMAANVSNISAGKEIGATPDGRHAHAPLSDAASPYFGRDTRGPTAFLHSAAAPDYTNVIAGSVINMKFEPDFFKGETGATRFGAFTRYFVKNRIPELQFNFTGMKTLLKARVHPENYGDLVVRVSGFSAYFVRLSSEVQDDIIRRRGHGDLQSTGAV